ncbi:hypothetical protein BB560_002455 [Smittium megazygosporum]|uniref:3-hydroxyacyl-CoA dehydrogenase n=1 Tax=Smittium megazygosporum TaxID=133381 RepID=A0A2T9ZEV2_9FUNG|nr:hypothetical protein BB560_002455 [Smittium megazygosporum]
MLRIRCLSGSLKRLPQSTALFSRSYIAAPPSDATKSSENNQAVPEPFKKVCVFGVGLMGSGIAQVSAMSDYGVTVVDLNEDALNRGQAYILKSLKRVAKKKFEDQQEQIKFTEDVLSKIEFTTKMEDAVPSADLVVEAVVENVDLKKKIFADLEPLLPADKDVVLATNTSSCSVTEIFSGISKERLPNTAGLHFFNPVSQMKLVEIVKTDSTSEATYERLNRFVLSLKKAPVKCKDTPGFIVNRLLVPYMMEAIRLLERGDASARDIDTAMKLGAGYPMGPFELLDYVGLDTTAFIIKGWDKNPELKEAGITAESKMLTDLVNAGRLGIKSGSGFYEYKKK